MATSSSPSRRRISSAGSCSKTAATACGARKAYEQGEFLASTDERFRPVYLSNAPDGTLYIADMYRGIIEHRISITEYLRDQILARKLEQPTGYGRIYRVMHETTTRDTNRSFASASAAELVEGLSHPNGWWRDTAQRLLVERGAKPVVPALVALARKRPTGARVCTRCGRWMASMPSSRRWSRPRSRISRETFAHPRSASPSGGWATPIIRYRLPC